MRNSSTKIARATLVTATDTAIVIPAVTGLKWNLRRLHIKSLISAAFTILIEGGTSGKAYYKLPASWPVDAVVDHEITAYDPSELSEALIITASAAGASIWVVAEYEVISV